MTISSLLSPKRSSKSSNHNSNQQPALTVTTTPTNNNYNNNFNNNYNNNNNNSSHAYQGSIHSPNFQSPSHFKSQPSPPQSPTANYSPVHRVSSPLAQPPKTFDDFHQRNISTALYDNSDTSSSSFDTKHLSSKINTTSISEASSFYDQTSPNTTSHGHRRTLSDKVKITPSSFVRHSRTFSDTESHHSANSLSGKSFLLQSKLQLDNLQPEFIPIVTLLNAQKLRTYSVGSFQIPGLIGYEKVWIEVDAKLTGCELSIWRPSTDDFLIDDGNDEFKPKYINLIDCNVETEVNLLQIKIYQDYRDDYAMIIRCNTLQEYDQWCSSIYLSKFEYAKLNEAYTAVVLSNKGSKLSDIHVLLNHKKRFDHSEWCNIRLPEISSKWLKVFVIVLPSDGKHLGRIEFYSQDKKLNHKHLIGYIINLSSAFNVYPEQPNMIDYNSIINAQGEIYINKHFEHLFPHQSNEISDARKLIGKNFDDPISRSGSTNSLSSLSSSTLQPPKTRSRSSSVNSTSSFFNSPKSKTRSASQSSNHKLEHKRTNSNFFKKHADSFVLTRAVYIMPVSHPGVNAIETMVRNYIPIIDAFKLYGRPKCLNSNKNDPQSMLFGLPSLPHYQYLSALDAESSFASSREDNQNFIIDKIQSIPNYKGHGDVTKLYNNLDLNFEEITSPVLTSMNDNSLPSLGEPINLNDKGGPINVVA